MKIQKLNEKERLKLIPSYDLKESLKEPVFMLISHYTPHPDKLIEVEIALRKCERLGVFRK